MATKPLVVTESLSKAIIRLSDTSNAILNSGLNEKALIALLHDDTGISKRTIGKVLMSMRELRANYTHGQ